MPFRIAEISFLAKDIKPTSFKTTKDLRSLEVYLLLVTAKEEIIALLKKMLIKLI